MLFKMGNSIKFSEFHESCVATDAFWTNRVKIKI